MFEGTFNSTQTVDVGTPLAYFEFSRFSCVTEFTTPDRNFIYDFTYFVTSYPEDFCEQDEVGRENCWTMLNSPDATVFWNDFVQTDYDS